MLDEMTPLQYAKWRAFARVCPFGDERADLRNALLALAIDAVVARIVDADPFLDPDALMPFVFGAKSKDDDGWEDSDLMMAKLEARAQRCD